MTTLVTEPGQMERDLDTARRRVRTLTRLASVLAVALIALGAWALYDITATSTAGVSDEISQLVDDYSAAWNGYDREAFLGMTTENYLFVSPDGRRLSRETTADAVAAGEATNGAVTILGEPIMVGEGPWYVAIANEITDDATAGNEIGVSVLRIVDDNGTLKVASHTWFSEP